MENSQQHRRQHNNAENENENKSNSKSKSKSKSKNNMILLANDGGEDITGGVGDILGVDPIAVNKLLNNELNQLSLDRREQLLEEIHGINNGGGALQFGNGNNDQQQQQEEEDNALRQFQEALDSYYTSETATPTSNNNNNNNNINHNNSNHNYNYDYDYNYKYNYKYPAYRYAREHGSELIYDRDFRLTFFSRDGGCPKEAATRMLNYLEFIREIYDTTDILFRPICLSDLSEQQGAKATMYEEGPLQILPVRDASGRRVCAHLRDFGPSSCPIAIRQQVGMYLAQCLVEDQDGVVFVFFLHHAHHNIYDADEFRNVNRVLKTIPPKFSAFHLCCPEGQLYNIAKAAVTLLIGKDNRERLRFHVGSYQECKYALRPFGIPVDRLPFELDLRGGKGKRKQLENVRNHQKWLKMREAKENAMFAAIRRDSSGSIRNSNSNSNNGDSFTGVMAAVRDIRSKFLECPRHEDCLFGKGRPAMYHPGNIAMRRLLDEKIDRFEDAAPTGKSVVVWEVVHEIKRGTGRFLKEDTDHAGLFVITDDETAFKKIAIAFRDLKKRRLREEEQKVLGLERSLQQQRLQTWQLPPTMVRGRKRPASAATSPTMRTECTPVPSNLGVNMNDAGSTMEPSFFFPKRG